jgi:hypothetical protein
MYSYLLVDQVVYLTICDGSYPRRLAFSYLDELSKEFQRSYESQIASANRPYCFRGFGTSSLTMRGTIEMEPEISNRHSSNRHIHLENDSTVSRPSHRRSIGSGVEYGQVEQRLARCDQDHDQEHGGSVVARRQLRS